MLVNNNRLNMLWNKYIYISSNAKGKMVGNNVHWERRSLSVFRSNVPLCSVSCLLIPSPCASPHWHRELTVACPYSSSSALQISILQCCVFYFQTVFRFLAFIPPQLHIPRDLRILSISEPKLKMPPLFFYSILDLLSTF